MAAWLGKYKGQYAIAMLSCFVLMGPGAGADALAQSPSSPEVKGTFEPSVIVLTQTGCQFLEPEAGVDHGYKTGRKQNCIKINEETGEARVAKSNKLQLKPGKYVFRVSNRNVPYELGFWLRGAGLARLIQPNVSGGGLTEGKTRDYAVELTAGEYVYSCPLNTTPDYPLVVTE